jgi:Holliday junction resolvase RusA-like endonuclease
MGRGFSRGENERERKMQPVKLSLCIPMSPMGKERPRVTRKGTFMPKAYKVWQSQVRMIARSQIPTSLLSQLPLLCRLRWRLVISVPKGIMRPDGDNAEGALWDALQVPVKGGWGIIQNDKQFTDWAGRVVSGPTMMRIEITEILPGEMFFEINQETRCI